MRTSIENTRCAQPVSTPDMNGLWNAAIRELAKTTLVGHARPLLEKKTLLLKKRIFFFDNALPEEESPLPLQLVVRCDHILQKPSL